MLNRLLPIALLAIPLAGCSAVGQLTIKDYRAKSGQRVMAGQAEPTSEYQCQKLAQEKQDWGFKGNLDRAAAIERVTSVAVDAAPAKGANYVYVMAPSEKSIGGFNLNAFSDAQVLLQVREPACARRLSAGRTLIVTGGQPIVVT